MANNVKVLKLITGEEVITRVTESDHDLITLDRPMILTTIPNHQTKQLAITMIPWIQTIKNVVKEGKVTFSKEYILVEGDPTETLERKYLSTITGLTL